MYEYNYYWKCSHFALHSVRGSSSTVIHECNAPWERYYISVYCRNHGLRIYLRTHSFGFKIIKSFVLAVGILLGTIILTLMELFVPHEDPEHSIMKSPHTTSSFLFLSAMALHNLPEGLSVGVSYGSTVHDLGAILAVNIGLQNIPEGFLTAFFLITHRMKKWLAQHSRVC
jgi:zinc transporter ZupT